MRKVFFFFAAAALTLASCNKSYEISVEPTLINAPQAGGVYEISLNCNAAWTSKIDGNVNVIVDPDFGAGSAVVTLTIPENLLEEPLDGIISFTCGPDPSKIATVTISQHKLTTVSWGGVDYPVKKMKDGNYWFTQNLRYVPEGLTPCKDLNNVTAGIYCPVVLNATQTGAEFSEDEAIIARNGYLYQAETALGLAVGSITTVEQAIALEAAQGICPPGWHLPTLNEILGLVGKASQAETNPQAPYYNGTDGSIVLLNKDGFNMDAFGAVTIQDNTKTAGTFMGWLKAFPSKISSGMFCGSSFATGDKDTKYDTDGKIIDIKFYGFMPMTNKATEEGYTCNGTKVSYRIAAPVRCIKNKLIDK